MFRCTYLIAALFITLNSANAQMGGMGEQEVYIPDVDKESLILLRPDKWYPYFKESEQRVDTYYFPTGQKPENWKEAIQSQRYLSTMGVTEASAVFDVRTQANAPNCETHEVMLITNEAENGYSKSEWLETCVNADDSQVTTLNKAIVGNEQLYVVSKIWKYEPKENDMEEWKRFMGQVYVCDPTTENNPCRPPNGPQGGRGGPR